MTLAEHFPAASGWDLKILATDLDTNVLARAEAGVYPLTGLEAIPKRQHHYLQSRAEEFSISSQIKKLIFFKQLNLLEPWPMQGPFDAIFCRNVLIYFDQSTKQKIVAGFRKLLADDGVLFIGHSESLTNISREFETVAQTTYRLRHQNSILPRQSHVSGSKESY
jgi:chemotaxis protein methyltransferase CheR